MEIKNFTGHTVRYFGPDGEIEFPPDGDVQMTYDMDNIGPGLKDGKRIYFYSKTFRRSSLPPIIPGRYYIVATLVAAAFPERGDLISPSDSIRDKETGEVIGCSSFSNVTLPKHFALIGEENYAVQKEEKERL